MSLKQLSIISFSIIVATTLVSLILNRNLPQIALSDLGSSQKTQVLFNVGILAKAIFDFVWLSKVLNRTQLNKYQAKIIWIFPISFLMLGIIQTHFLNLIHWMFAVMYFLIILYFQKRVSKLDLVGDKFSKSSLNFIYAEIIVALLGFISQKFYLPSETIVFTLINIWQFRLSNQIQNR